MVATEYVMHRMRQVEPSQPIGTQCQLVDLELHHAGRHVSGTAKT